MTTKVAIFVEGQSELIFTREFLIKYFEYYDVRVVCYKLLSDSLQDTEYPFGVESASNYFQIIDVGNDKRVLSEMNKRKKLMLERGFSRIIGLRDMYSEEYNTAVQNRAIKEEENQKFIAGARAQIEEENIYFCFAIMEMEAWILGLNHVFPTLHKDLTNENIREKLGIDLNKVDPETIFFHPAKVLGEVYELVGMKYDKTKDNANSFSGILKRPDYLALLRSGKCASFKEFCSFLGFTEDSLN